MTERAISNTFYIAFLQAFFDYTHSRGLADKLLLSGTPLYLLDDEARCSEIVAAPLF